MGGSHHLLTLKWLLYISSIHLQLLYCSKLPYFLACQEDTVQESQTKCIISRQMSTSKRSPNMSSKIIPSANAST